MKEAWDELGVEYDEHDVVLIGDVDCTQHRGLCASQGVKGFPTLKYYNAQTGPDGEVYEGERELPDLMKFVQAKLHVCNPISLVGCNGKKKEYITKMKALTREERKAEQARLQKMVTGSIAEDKKKWMSERIIMLRDMKNAEL